MATERIPRWRVGGHWGVTIVEVGSGPPTGQGRRRGDRLVAMTTGPTAQEDARRIVAALNTVEPAL